MRYLMAVLGALLLAGALTLATGGPTTFAESYFNTPENSATMAYNPTGGSPPPAFSGPASATGDFTFYAVYDRLVDTANQNLLVDETAMSGNGRKLIFGARDATSKQSVVYTADLDTSTLSRVALPPDLAKVGLADFTMNASGSRAFFRVAACCGVPWSIYKVENGAATLIFDPSAHAGNDPGGASMLRTTANGEHVYFLDDAPNDNDVWRIRHDGSGLELVIDDTRVPRDGGAGSQVGEFAISDDGRVIAFTLMAYWAPKDQRSGIFDNGYRSKDEVFIRDAGGYRQLTNSDKTVGKDKLDISGDGGAITYRNISGENRKRYSMKSDGSARVALDDVHNNATRPHLTRDGSRMFYNDNGADGGGFLYTDGSGKFSIFPAWDVNNIALAAHHGLSMSSDGSRISFVVSTGSFPSRNALYVGYLNGPSAGSRTPAITSISFAPPALPDNDPEARVAVASQIGGGQSAAAITRTDINQLINGELVSTNSNEGAFRVAYSGRPRDDGEVQDSAAGDGTFTADVSVSTSVSQFDQVTVRVAVMDRDGTVTVADRTLPIGAGVLGINPTPLPSPTSEVTLLALQAVVAPEETITLRYSGAPGHATDWIALYPIGNPNERYGQWHYLERQAEGVLTFIAPDREGMYEFRLFANWPAGSYNVVARSNQVRVTSAAGPAPDPTPAPPPTVRPRPTATPEPTSLPVLGRAISVIAEARTVAPGGAVQMPVRLENAEGISSLGFNLHYDPTVVRVQGVLKGARMAPATFTYNADAAGVIRLGYASNRAVSGDGSAAVLEFAAVGARGDRSPITLSDVLATDSSGRPLPVRLFDGSVTIEQRLAGDGNGDGEVTALDALIALKMFVQAVPEDLVMDVNGDGRVTPEDARQILALARPR